jgi:hypothetical protein
METTSLDISKLWLAAVKSTSEAEKARTIEGEATHIVNGKVEPLTPHVAATTPAAKPREEW